MGVYMVEFQGGLYYLYFRDCVIMMIIIDSLAWTVKEVIHSRLMYRIFG